MLVQLSYDYIFVACFLTDLQCLKAVVIICREMEAAEQANAARVAALLEEVFDCLCELAKEVIVYCGRCGANLMKHFTAVIYVIS